MIKKTGTILAGSGDGLPHFVLIGQCKNLFWPSSQL